MIFKVNEDHSKMKDENECITLLPCYIEILITKTTIIIITILIIILFKDFVIIYCTL